MPLRARTLLGPGPSNPYPEATVALGYPLLGHLDPVFLGILDETSDRLRQVFGTANRRTLPLSATGSAGMEAAFVNTVGPGDVVVVAVNGLFGQRMVDVASRCGAEVIAVEHEWGAPVDPERVLAAHPSPKLIAAVHAETSTGVRSDLVPLAEGKGDALLLADCVTSLGGLPAGRDPRAAGRVGRRPGVLRLAEVPGDGARAGPLHDQRPRVGAADREAAELVPRPGHARRLRRGGGRFRRPHLPPHGAHRHGGVAERGARPDPRGGARGRARPARGGRAAAARRPAGDGSGAVRGRGVPAAGADDGARPGGRRLGGRAQGTPGALRPGDRR